MDRPLNIAALSYPLLFQTIGGLQVQVLETVEAVCRAGHAMRLIDPVRERFVDFDLVHVFSVAAGNHTIVGQAAWLDVPVVLSPLVSRWNRSLARRARLVDRIAGRLTRWELTTNYRWMHAGLHTADHCVALGEGERRMILEAFDVPPERVSVVPNGIPSRFFAPDPAAALAHFGVAPGYALCVASIDTHKNQLGLARALQGTGIPLVLVGECMPANRAYLAEVLAVPGTRHLGSLAHDDPLLPGLYAGASVTCLTSWSEVMPLAVLESMAAGTPAVVTRHHGMDVGTMRAALREVNPRSAPEIAAVVRALVDRPPTAEQCREAVAHLSWDAVAAQLCDVYGRVTAGDRRNTPPAGP
jgi:glycosyltransferase involved in cell wall biosynthesis